MNGWFVIFSVNQKPMKSISKSPQCLSLFGCSPSLFLPLSLQKLLMFVLVPLVFFLCSGLCSGEPERSLLCR